MPDTIDPGTPGTEAPEVSADDKRLANLVNAAVGSHLKRHLPKALEETVSPLFAGFKEHLAGILPKPAAVPAPAGAGSAGPSDETTARVTSLENALAQERAERAAERREAHETKAFNDLRTALTGKVRPEALDITAKHLFHAEKAVKVRKDGRAVMTIDGEEYESLAEGVSAWASKPEAAFFLPPPPKAAARRPAAPVPPRGAPTASASPVREDPLTKTLERLRDLGHIV